MTRDRRFPLRRITWPAVALTLTVACERRLPSYEITAFAMNTIVNVRAVAPDEATAHRAADAALASLRETERLASYPDPASDLSRLNREGVAGPVIVSSGLYDVIDLSLKMAARTGGWFDPTVGPLVDLYGFKRGQPRVPADREIAAAKIAVGYGKLALAPATRTVTFGAPGMKLDLSGIAKGWAVDRAAAAMKRAGATAGIVEAGGEVACFGGGPYPGRAWRIGIKNPRAPGLYGTIAMKDGACATSGDYEQRYEAAGVRFSHLFDPFAGRPVARAAGVTVVAPTCAEADAWATALAVMPAAAADAAIKRADGPRALIIREEENSLRLKASRSFPPFEDTRLPRP